MNTCKKRHCSNKGFTLIEILVVLAIIGIILPVLYMIFSNSLNNMEAASAKVEHLGSLRILLDRMRREISCAFISSDPGYERCFIGKKDGTEEIPMDSLSFLTLSHQWRGGTHESYDLSEIGYRIVKREEKDQVEGLPFLDKYLGRREDVSPDSDIERGGSELEMAEFIHAMRVRYYDGNIWVDEWDSKLRNGLPERVRVELIPAPETGLDRTFSIIIPVQLQDIQRTGNQPDNTPSGEEEFSIE